MRKPLISVIIPVFNAEKTLKRCIDSVLCQTYKELEIILVDDGSRDNSAIICKKYTVIDNRIRYIYQENAGVSEARNRGLDYCTGEYIAFIDSDDYIQPEMYETMLNCLKAHKVDCCVCQFMCSDSHGTVSSFDDIYMQISGEYSALSFEKLMIFADHWYKDGFVCVPWNKLYKRSIFTDLRFFGNYAEDYRMAGRINSRNTAFVVIPNAFYIYCYNESSLTKQPFSKDRLLFLDFLQEQIELFSFDASIVTSTEIKYCNVFVEYYFKCFDMRIDLEKRFFDAFKYMLKCLWRNRYCNLKFYLRMICFLISPQMYRVLARGRV